MNEPNAQPMPLLPEEVAYVNTQIRLAGQFAEETLRTLNDQQVEQKAPGEFITVADIEIAKRLSRAILSRFPLEIYGVMIEDADRLPLDCRDPDAARKQKIFVIDPIDGTDNYYPKCDGQYCVMIGLLIEAKLMFGWIYAPARDTLYFGGPGYGVFRQRGVSTPESLLPPGPSPKKAVRLMMGSRDPGRKQVERAFEQIEWVKMGSLGLKVVHIIEGHADLYLHLVRKLKVWDTAAPVALALAAGLKVCSLKGTPLDFDVERPQHDQAIIIGRADWVDEASKRLQNS